MRGTMILLISGKQLLSFAHQAKTPMLSFALSMPCLPKLLAWPIERNLHLHWGRKERSENQFGSVLFECTLSEAFRPRAPKTRPSTG